MKGAIIGAPPAVKYLRKDQLGAANGVAPLDDEGKLCTDNLPAALAELVEGDGSVAAHTHGAGDISSGIFGVPRGGTGLATLTKDSFLVGNGANAVQLLTAAQALSKMGAAASGHKHSGADITSGLDTLANSLSGYLSGAKIQTGSYTGTGTYGSANPCSLTFDFVPMVLMFFQDGSFSMNEDFDNKKNPWIFSLSFQTSYFDEYIQRFYESAYENTKITYYRLYTKVSSDKKTFSWYHEYNAVKQLNYAGSTYHWLAIV